MGFQGFHIEALWGKTLEEAENVAQILDIPFSTSRIDDLLLRKDVDLILVLCPPSLHSQIAVKALGRKCVMSHILSFVLLYARIYGNSKCNIVTTFQA